MASALQDTLRKGLLEEPKKKYWEDLAYDERVDRLVELVDSMHRTVQVQSRLIQSLKQELREHEHDNNGKPFVREYLNEQGKKTYDIHVPYQSSNPLNRKRNNDSVIEPEPPEGY